MKLFRVLRRFWKLACCEHPTEYCLQMMTPGKLYHWHLCKDCLQVVRFEEKELPGFGGQPAVERLPFMPGREETFN